MEIKFGKDRFYEQSLKKCLEAIEYKFDIMIGIDSEGILYYSNEWSLSIECKTSHYNFYILGIFVIFIIFLPDFFK